MAEYTINQYRGVYKRALELYQDEKYKEWQKSVFQRDYYSCPVCGCKKEINAHHLWSWKEYPEKSKCCCL